jgi:probable phosphomutase (TIGR03848 family)
VTRLILIRHAPTAETGKRLTGRLPGVGLSAAGRRAAEALARSLAAVPLEAVYTSPVLRCRETAVLVAGPHGLRPLALHAVSEVDFGAWSGRTLASLRRTALWRLVHSAPSRAVFPNGESLAAAQHRAVAACEALAAARPAATLAVVSHGDVIALILAHYLGMPLDLYHRLSVPPASASTLDLPGDGPASVRSLAAGPEIA